MAPTAQSTDSGNGRIVLHKQWCIRGGELTYDEEPVSITRPKAPPALTLEERSMADSSYEAMFQRNTISQLLTYIVGEDASREGLRETPARVVKAWQHWCKGYNENPADILKVFEDGAAKYDEMVLVRDIPLYSKCEHHLADIFGTASVAYIPNGKIVGLSKISRLVDCFARRLQVQERLTVQIADALVEHLQPKGVGVIVRARHMCMESRGICQQGHHTVTTALRGVIKEDSRTRSEFLAACAV